MAASLAELTVDRETFERVRRAAPRDEISLAARTIYLNRTAFGGLWRVNARGEFNVPYGCKPETRLPSRDELRATSHVLTNSQLEDRDFGDLATATPAGIIYFDPPYTIAHNANGFVRYNERIFSWFDQIRLAKHATNLAYEGKKVIVSNAFHRDVRDLYSAESFKFYRVNRNTNLAASAAARGRVDELLVVSRNVRFLSLPSFATRMR